MEKCRECENEFIKIPANKVFCCQKCNRRYHKKVEREKDKLKRLAVKSEAMVNMKYLYNPSLGKPWSRRRSECRYCHQNVYRHEGRGMCFLCYHQEANKMRLMKLDEDQKKSWYEENRENNKKRMRVVKKMFNEIKNDTKDPRVINIITNHDDIK